MDTFFLVLCAVNTLTMAIIYADLSAKHKRVVKQLTETHNKAEEAYKDFSRRSGMVLTRLKDQIQGEVTMKEPYSYGYSYVLAVGNLRFLKDADGYHYQGEGLTKEHKADLEDQFRGYVKYVRR